MIKKLRGRKKYRVYSKTTGKNLGTYDTRAEAENRERQVQFFKHSKDKKGRVKKK